jgi:excisionase family DNA binding protein
MKSTPEEEGNDGGSVMTDGLTWLTMKQAAMRAQVSEATLRREAKAGRLVAVKVGGRRTWRLRPGWVDEWLQQGIAEQQPIAG